MNEILSSPLFGMVLCIVTYKIGVIINNRVRSPFTNPMFIALILCSVFLLVFDIPYACFESGGNTITVLLAPATACLAVSMYRKMETLKENLLPVLCGCFAGALTAVVSIYLMCRLFGLSDMITASLLPKSVTTPIAMELSESLGGVPAITMLAITITGVCGAVFAPIFIKVFRVHDRVARGLGIGACSHGAGTSKAVEIGEVEGAMSGIAIGISGIFTVFISLVIQML